MDNPTTQDAKAAKAAKDAQIAQGGKFSYWITTDGYKAMIANVLRDPTRADRFVANIMAAYTINPALYNCEAYSILASGLLGESLGLSPSPQLGEFYMVPYEDKKAGVTKAQFQLGYIGLKQLAMNTGCYKRISVVTVKKGELKKFDPFTGVHEFEPITDPIKRAAAETMGYYGYYELLNGYREDLYMTREEMERHADRYSKAFKMSVYRDIKSGKIKQADMWKYSSPWYTAFETMAHKTIIRQLLKTAPKSPDMRRALESDNAVITKDLLPDIAMEELLPMPATDYEEVTDESDGETGEVTDEEPTDDPPASDPPTVSINDL